MGRPENQRQPEAEPDNPWKKILEVLSSTARRKLMSEHGGLPIPKTISKEAVLPGTDAKGNRQIVRIDSNHIDASFKLTISAKGLRQEQETPEPAKISVEWATGKNEWYGEVVFWVSRLGAAGLAKPDVDSPDSEEIQLELLDSLSAAVMLERIAQFAIDYGKTPREPSRLIG